MKTAKATGLDVPPMLAALAPAHKIVAAHDQGAYVRQFLDVSVAAALNALR